MHLDIYTTIKEIKTTNNKRITLVENQVDYCFYIKRELKYYNFDVYQKLKEISNLYIPKIYELDIIDNQLIIIEEYINNQTLDYYINNNKITNEQAVNIIIQLCNCLEQLHNLNPPIIHRDIKPENIFYDGNHIKLFDFDISRFYNEQKEKDTTVLGSVGYAAPEQFGFGQSSNKVDIYALGVLFHVLLTKQLPSKNIDCGKYSTIIKKAISIDEQQRYNNVSELRDKLKGNDFIFKARNIPGFRSRNMMHMVIALIGYPFLTLLAFCVEQEGVSKDLQGLIKIMYFGFFMISVFYWCNYDNVFDKLPGSNSSKTVRYGIIGLVYFVIVMIFSSLVTMM